MVDCVELHKDQVAIKFGNRRLLSAIGAEGAIQPSSGDLIIERPAARLRRGKALRLVLPATSPSDSITLRDEKLVALIAEFREIMSQLTVNPDKTILTLAEQGCCRVRMMKIAKLACLEPNIVTAIVEKRQPLKLTRGKLLAADIPLAWAEQRRVLGFG